MLLQQTGVPQPAQVVRVEGQFAERWIERVCAGCGHFGTLQRDVAELGNRHFG